ncbi:MAG TPA: Glu-tRNA(Gln) amidotransferase subunit GatE [Candidatus Aminicenantes bacterium]|nr:Glu-tRNA(Gln) amidotransferase subunit GatE [Candidatus Aminicenantes bacterium]HRY64511.1 Glu-tRNA(Gln) amidotransferase subunit GatE [Candidatus Aminicenantes bacterium]HRZ71424.1 Glu-tRNA(Gln) amidotransferase subunit GatE [Candidatus Aminicenantes bacterium]
MSDYRFQFKPFPEMTEADYAEIGFRSGLEIHQQLLTEKKLFCRCPAGRYSDAYDAEILRHMRPTLSELGEYDGTALMEFKTKKEIIYRINRETVCTYEMDDTPPFMIDEQALDIALGIAMLYRLNLVDELHIARKQYLDGSIPTGFQRTTIVGVTGSVPYKDRSVSIVQLGLEEDACREVSDVGHRRVYLTDRLGMPLIETVTGPDMRTPREAAEVAQILRRLVRSTGRVRTGIGAAREDVNVSVRGGTRIEIKGVPRIPRIPLLTYHEAMRQWNLLRLREELRRRGITAETFRSASEDVTRVLVKTSYQPIREALAGGATAAAVALRGFRDLLSWQTQTNTRFSREISDRVRVVACLTKLPNIIHSDSLSETLSSSRWDQVRKAVRAADDDTVVVVWGPAGDVKTAVEEIAARAREAAIGVPSETRQALRDGTNGFERILPGPDRMYPDTDLPPKVVTEERLERIRRGLPVPIWTREAWYREIGLPADVVEPLAMSRWAGLFEMMVKEWGIDPTAAAVALVQFPKSLARRGLDPSRLAEDDLRRIFALFRDRRISRDGVRALMERSVRGQGLPGPGEVRPATEEEIYARVADANAALRAMKVHNPDRKAHVLMGLVMTALRGRVEGAAVLERVTAAAEGTC